MKLLLDIDYTLFYGEQPRPHLKYFLEWCNEHCEDVSFYTAANHNRITDVCRFFYHTLKIKDHEFIENLNMFSFCNENVPMIDYKKPNGTYIEIKSLQAVADYTGFDVKDFFLIDDNPCYDHPEKDQIVQIPMFCGNENDTELLRMITILEKRISERSKS